MAAADLVEYVAKSLVDDPEAVRVALKLAGQIPDEGREKNGSFARSVEVPADASRLDRFLAILGRDPAWRVS